jgi:nicotinamide mononucleotide transporter
MPEILPWLAANSIELLASVFGIAGVWLTARQNIWCWPAWLVNVLLSVFVFYDAKLYATGMLQIFYLVMTVYGWVNWKYGGDGKTGLQIRRMKRQELIFLLLAGCAGTAVSGWIFSNYTDAGLPYWDSFITVWGVLGTFAMARKILEHWVIWIVIDIAGAGISFYNGLYFFTALYSVFVILAIYGIIQWKKEFRTPEASAA